LSAPETPPLLEAMHHTRYAARDEDACAVRN